MALRESSTYGDHKPPLFGRPRVSEIQQGREEEEGRVTWVLEGLAQHIGLGHCRRTEAKGTPPTAFQFPAQLL